MTSRAPIVEVAIAAMDTVFAVQLSDGTPNTDWLRHAATSALVAVRDVERTCSRFRADSELRQLCRQVGVDVPVSPLLRELVALALAVAEASNGAFDPTVGARLAALARDAGNGVGDSTSPRAPGGAGAATWCAVHVDAARSTIRLEAPLLLDLGAIAKGFAVDLVVTALRDDTRRGETCSAPVAVSVHAGGDVRCAGPHPEGRAWRVGVRDPQQPSACVAIASLESGAVCTSGSYERRNAAGGSHLLDPRTGQPASGYDSVTVAAPTAAIADAMATAAFVMGPAQAPAWLAAQGVDALLLREHHPWETVTAGGIATFTPSTASV